MLFLLFFSKVESEMRDGGGSGSVCQGISARSIAATGMNQRLLIHSSIRGNIPEGRKIRAGPYDGNLGYSHHPVL